MRVSAAPQYCRLGGRAVASPTDILYIAVLLFGAVALMLVGVLGLGAMLHVDRTVGRWLPSTVVPAMGLGVVISSLLSHRDLRYTQDILEQTIVVGSGAAIVSVVLRLLSLALVAFSVTHLVGGIFQRKQVTMLDGGKPLLVTFVVFYICNALLNAAFGTVPSFTHNTLYVPIVLFAIYAARHQPISTFITAAKLTLLIFMLLSLFVAFLKPELAVETGYKSWLPGVRFRLWGVGSHPNSTGPLALTLLLLEWMQPTRRALGRFLIWSSAAAVLILAQSKTAWGATLLVIPVLWWFRSATSARGAARVDRWLAVVIALIFLTLAVMKVETGPLSRVMSSAPGGDVTTLTGRVQIWAAAIDVWKTNVVFGYGPEAWSLPHRMSLGMPFAVSAHNQLLQSLSTAGLLGAVSLLVFMLMLLVALSQRASQTKGVSLALMLMLLLRCATEAPLSAATLFNGDTLTLVILLRMAFQVNVERQVPLLSLAART